MMNPMEIPKTSTGFEILPGAPLPLTGVRQQDKHNLRIKEKMEAMILSACKTSPMTQAAYNMGYNQGMQRGAEFSLKDGYAAAILAMQDLGRYGKKRGNRLLKRIDWYVVNRLTTEELVDEVLARVGVKIDFEEPFERVVDVDG